MYMYSRIQSFANFGLIFEIREILFVQSLIFLKTKWHSWGINKQL